MRRLLLLALTCGAFACSGESAPVYIATAGPWTEVYGEMNKRGIDLAVEEVNARGGINGRPLRLVERDDQAEGTKAAQIAGEFVANRDVVAVVGHVTSGAMMAAARVYDQGLPAVATTASTPELSGISPWVFRVISSDSANGLTIARYLNRLGLKRAAILYENNAYGRGLSESFRRGYAGSLVSLDPVPTEGTANFEPYIAFLKTRTPDVVFVAGTNGSGRAILREARRQNLSAAFIGGDGWSSVVADTINAEGVYVATPFTAEDPRNAAQQFVKAFRAKYRIDPDGNAALAYDATLLIVQAITRAGPSRAKVREWLAALNEQDAFPGVTGPIHFLPTGDVVGRGVVMTRSRSGALQVERGGSGS